MKDKFLKFSRCFICYLNKDKKIILASLTLGFTFTFLFGLGTMAYSYNVQNDIADNILRFHIRANSDSDVDQAMKLEVKNRVLDEFGYGLKSSNSKEETIDFLNRHLTDIENCGEEVVHEFGYDYDVTAFFTNDYFPEKKYGDITLPAGNYDALRIDIGSAQGHNWWCVMFPPLCFVDATQGEVDDSTKEELQSILTPDEYDMIDDDIRDDEPEVEIKFKVVEFWQEKFGDDAKK